MKRALVTGGSGTIGAAICQRLARMGLHVYVHCHQNDSAAKKVAAAIMDNGGSAATVNFNVTDLEQTKSELDMLLESGPVQIIVNNAGFHHDGPLAGLSPGDWHKVIDVSLNGFYNVTQPLLLPMIGTRWGRIINMSSVAGVMGNRGQANYAAAKSGLHGATKSLALELASRNITVNAVAPGIIESGMSNRSFSQEQVKALVPMKRAGKPEEVAALVSFLCSDEAGYISGQIIGINGGMA